MNWMLLGFENFITIVLGLIGLITVLYTQFKINSVYKKYIVVMNRKQLGGMEIARMILDKNNLQNIYVVQTKGIMSDHYDPNRKVIRLSPDVFNKESISSASIAAHEVGHAIQDKEGYPMMRFRSALVPFVNLVSYLGYFGLIVSLLAGVTGYLFVSIIILIAFLLFQLATLPVEFDASKRALKELQELQILDEEEIEDSKEVLKAAAFTYVAGLVSNILQLLRLIIMLKDSDR